MRTSLFLSPVQDEDVTRLLGRQAPRRLHAHQPLQEGGAEPLAQSCAALSPRRL